MQCGCKNPRARHWIARPRPWHVVGGRGHWHCVGSFIDRDFAFDGRGNGRSFVAQSHHSLRNDFDGSCRPCLSYVMDVPPRAWMLLSDAPRVLNGSSHHFHTFKFLLQPAPAIVYVWMTGVLRVIVWKTGVNVGSTPVNVSGHPGVALPKDANDGHDHRIRSERNERTRRKEEERKHLSKKKAKVQTCWCR